MTAGGESAASQFALQVAKTLKEDPQQHVLRTSVSEHETPVVSVGTSESGEEVKQNGDVDVDTDAKVSQPQRKMKPKQARKELNKKFEARENSGDYEAFVDAPSSPIPPTPPKTPPLLTSVVAQEMKLPDPCNEKDAASNDDVVVEKNKANEELSHNNVTVDDSVIHSDSELVTPERLKFEYKEDQWSPINQSGKKQYDRDLLLKLSNTPLSKKRPDGLPQLDGVTSKPGKSRSMTARTGGIDFNPGFVMKHQHGGRSSANIRSGGRNQPRPAKVISISLKDVKLHETENAWKPGKLAKDESSENKTEEEKALDELNKKVRSILNKLTPQKFESLVDKMKNLPIKNSVQLRSVIDLIFEKATDEPSFTKAYAKMCDIVARRPASPNPEGQITDQQHKVTTEFRRILLAKCQAEFEKNISQELDKELKLKEIEDAETEEKKKELTENLALSEQKAKRRYLGNIKFIGELYMLGMLTIMIMHSCIQTLLTSWDKEKDEDSLECMCKLFATIGKQFEDDKKNQTAKQKNLTPEEHTKKIAGYFDDIHKIIENRETSSRVRFMLQDVVELKRNRWIPRRDENNPKTIDQIHQEVQQEDLKRIYDNMEHQQRKRERPQPPPQQKVQLVDQSDWKTIGGSKSGSRGGQFKYEQIDPGRMKLSQLPLNSSDSVQLGPGARMNSWSQGARGGKMANEEKPAVVREQNRFDALLGSSSEPSVGRNGPYTRNSGGRYIPRGPTESERKDLFDQVKTHMDQSSKSNKSIDRDSPVTHDNSERSTPETPSELPSELADKYAHTILMDYAGERDLKDALCNIEEKFSSQNIHQFVFRAALEVVDKSEDARVQLSEIIAMLVTEKLITKNQFVIGFTKLMANAVETDLITEVPRLFQYIGQILGPLFKNRLQPLEAINDISQPWVEAGKRGAFLAQILLSIESDAGPQLTKELFDRSHIQLAEYLDNSHNETEFIAKHHLEFLSPTPAVRSKMDMNLYKKLLQVLDTNRTDNNEAIFDFVEKEVGLDKTSAPEFIRALVTAVTQHAIDTSEFLSNKDTERLKETLKIRKNLLKRYLASSSNPVLTELQSIYAVQALIHKLENPQGLIHVLFECNYDEMIWSEDACFQWESSEDETECEGRAVAQKALNQFFTWLKEAEVAEEA